MQIGHHFIGGQNAHFHRQHQGNENQPEKKHAEPEPEIDDGVGGQKRNGNLPKCDAHGHDQAVEHHGAHGGPHVSGSHGQCPGIVFHQLTPRQQGKVGGDGVEGVGGGDKGDVYGKRQNRSTPKNQSGVGKKCEQGAVFNH